MAPLAQTSVHFGRAISTSQIGPFRLALIRLPRVRGGSGHILRIAAVSPYVRSDKVGVRDRIVAAVAFSGALAQCSLPNPTSPPEGPHTTTPPTGECDCNFNPECCDSGDATDCSNPNTNIVGGGIDCPTFFADSGGSDDLTFC